MYVSRGMRVCCVFVCVLLFTKRVHMAVQYYGVPIDSQPAKTYDENVVCARRLANIVD